MMTLDRPNRPVWPWYLAFAVLVASDQFAKHLVRQNFTLHESIPIFGDLLRLTYVENPGIAFGLTILGPMFLLVFGWTAVIALSIYLFKLTRAGDPMRWPVLLFLSGATGNSIDRLIFGKVTDFMDADFPNFIMERWPVFNIADSCVTVGICLVIIFSFSGRLHRSEQYDLEHGKSASPSDSLPDFDSTRSESRTD